MIDTDPDTGGPIFYCHKHRLILEPLRNRTMQRHKFQRTPTPYWRHRLHFKDSPLYTVIGHPIGAFYYPMLRRNYECRKDT